MAPGDRHDLVHFATNAGIMNRENGSRARRYRRFDEALVDVQRVRADVDEHRRRAAQHDGVGGGDEGVGRQNHFVARTEAAQQRRHLERCGAGRGQQDTLSAETLLEELLGAAGEAAAAAGVAAGNGLTDVDQLRADDAWFIERDANCHGAGLKERAG